MELPTCQLVQTGAAREHACYGHDYLVVERQDRAEVKGLLDIVGLGRERDVGGVEHILSDVEDLIHPWELQHQQM